MEQRDLARSLGRVETKIEEHDDRLAAHDVVFARVDGNIANCASGIEAITARLDKRDEDEADQRKTDAQNRRDDRRLIVTTALAAATLVIGALGLFAHGGIG